MKIEISISLAEEILTLFASSRINVMSDKCREFKNKLENIKNYKLKGGYGKNETRDRII